MEIAGSPRNIFRYSLTRLIMGVKHSLDFGVITITRSLLTLNTIILERRSQTAGDKFRGREGNSPDR